MAVVKIIGREIKRGQNQYQETLSAGIRAMPDGQLFSGQ
jgi:hypothetical protein